MVEKLTFSSVGHSCSQHANCKTLYICGIVLCYITAHFIVAFIVPSTSCTCVMTMLLNHLLDIPHLSGGWIILENDKCLLIGM